MIRDPSGTFGKLVTYCLNDDSEGGRRSVFLSEMFLFGLGIASSVVTTYFLAQLNIFV
jgi:hypothetical protein